MFHVTLKLRLVDLNYNFECDWLIELSDNKLPGNNLASELVENRSFLNQSQSRKFVIFYDYLRNQIMHFCHFQRNAIEPDPRIT